MFKAIAHVKKRFGFLKKISELPIKESGFDGTDAYVRLENGTIFYGPASRPKDEKYYNRLNKKVKKVLSFEAMMVAQNIMIRYVEGGLKYGGPKKNSIYEVKQGDTVAEMGAYMGYYSIKMAQVVGESGTVVMIEPMPDNLRILRKNVEANGLKNCIIVPKGVWNKPDTLHFSRTEGDGQSGSALMHHGQEDLSIEVDCLDNLIGGQGITHCDQMVIQLNGVEIEALEGLTSFKPKHIAIAARYDREGVDTIQSICDTLTSRGYEATVREERYVFAKLLVE